MNAREESPQCHHAHLAQARHCLGRLAGRRLRHRPHHALLVCAAAGGAGRYPRPDADRAGPVPVARRRLRGLPYRTGRQAVRRWPRHADADGHDLLDQHHARSADRHRCLRLRRLRTRGAPWHPPRWPAVVSSHAVRLVCDRQRCRGQGAVRLLHGLGAAGETGQRRQHHPLAGQHALAIGLVAAAVRAPTQLQPGSEAGCRPAARR